MEPAKRKRQDPGLGGKKPKVVQSKLPAEETKAVVTANPHHIVSWNVNGLRAFIKKQSDNAFLQRSDYDVLCLNETKLQDSNVAEFRSVFSRFPHQYWSCSQAKKGYSGVCILSKLPAISVKYGIDARKHDQEGRVVTAEFPDFFIVSSYIPNAGQKLERLEYRVSEWDIAMRQHLKHLEAQGKGVIWLGDLNVVHQEIDIYSFKGKDKSAGCTPEERKSFGETLADGFVDSFRQLYPARRTYSWYSDRNPNARRLNQGWRLDYIVVSEAFMSRVEDSIIHDSVEGSDHVPIEIVIRPN
jgi:exodeoxyribonuclease III